MLRSQGILSRLFPAVILLVLIWIGLVSWWRGAAVDEATNAVRPGLNLDSNSLSGYEGNRRALIVPGRWTDSAEWIVQAQLQRQAGVSHLSKVDYDNAPVGRHPGRTTPYRMLLWGAGWLEQRWTDLSGGAAIERAALWLDPALWGMFVVGAGLFMARRLGAGAGIVAVVALGLAAPFADVFRAGRPDSFGLGLVLGFFSFLAVFTGPRSIASGIFGGVCGGLGFWVNAPLQTFFLVATLVERLVGLIRPLGSDFQDTKQSALRSWYVAGAAVTLFAIWFEVGSLNGAGWSWVDLSLMHALAWPIAGELALQCASAKPRGRIFWTAFALLALGVIAFVGGAIAADRSLPSLLWARAVPWAAEAVWPAYVAFGVALSLALLAYFRGVERGAVLRLGLVAILALAVGFLYPRLLPIAVGFALLSAAPILSHAVRAWNGIALLVLFIAVSISGVTTTLEARRSAQESIQVADAGMLIDRDVAYWLSQRVGSAGATVLAPPELSNALQFYGGHRVIGTTYPANGEGFAAAVRLCGASSPDEAKSLLEGRGVTHVILPSWDDGLMDYARLGAKEPDKGFISLLKQWLPPLWLRPVPYTAPAIAGLGERSVAIFEVVEMQDQATALAHLGMYFSDTGRIAEAGSVASLLARSYPDELISVIARAQAAALAHDVGTQRTLLNELVSQVEAGNDELLPWDDRVALVLVLFEGRKGALGKERLEQCLATAEESALRKLPPFSLYHLVRASRALKLAWPSDELQQKAVSLLPAELRQQL